MAMHYPLKILSGYPVEDRRGHGLGVGRAWPPIENGHIIKGFPREHYAKDLLLALARDLEVLNRS